MSKWVIPFVCLILITTGGCSGKKQKGLPPVEIPQTEVKPGKIVFESYDISKAPEKIRVSAEKNRDRETAALLEDQNRFWLLLTRGEKPTGGYSILVSEAFLDVGENGTTKLKVSYKYTDPGPGQFVTQALTYPMELVLLKNLKKKPDSVVFVQVQQ